MNRKALGKGINALIPDFEMGVPDTGAKEGLMELLIDDIVPNTNQPRKLFDEARLEELVESIRENGVIQPVVVQRGENKYELICGERRWRASKKAGFKKIPALVKEVSSTESLQIAIIENIHRQDLNPIEEAEAYQRLAHEFGLTQEAISKRVGKKRATIANYLRLLKLSRGFQEDLVAGTLSMGHARAILGLSEDKDMEALRLQVRKKSLNVRQVEHLVQKIKQGGQPGQPKKQAHKDIFSKNLENELQRALGTKVEIHPGGKGGKMVIHYHSNDDMGRIRDIILGKQN